MTTPLVAKAPIELVATASDMPTAAAGDVDEYRYGQVEPPPVELAL
jgi:hypothetical protein